MPVWRTPSLYNQFGAIPRNSPFDHTLARNLDLDRHCIPLVSALSSPEYRKKISQFPNTERQLLFDEFLRDFKHHRARVKGNSRQLKCLEEQYGIARFFASLRPPIYQLPTELLSEILHISAESLDVPQDTLRLVCRTWRDLVVRLWGVLRVATWTEIESITGIVNRGPRSLDVVIDAIDTTMDEGPSVPSTNPYAALAFAWDSAPRWRSLIINSFPSTASILAYNVTFDPDVPLTGLNSLSFRQGCDSSDGVQYIMEAIASTATPKLDSLTLAAATVLRQLDPSHWVHVLSRLTALDVDVAKIGEPVDLLRHCAHLERLKLSGIVSHRLFPEDDLPFLNTLRQLWLKQTSIQWMVGRIFQRLESCTLFRPVDAHTMSGASIVDLPVCMNITLQSYLINILAAFNAPVANNIRIECNQSSKARASLEFGRAWSRNWVHGMRCLKILSLNMVCDDRLLLETLRQMSSLEELTLELPHPGTLRVGFFKGMCATPMKPFTGKTEDEWAKWTYDDTLWEAKICPSLVSLQLQYKRWLRRGEMDTVTPMFIGVAWSRRTVSTPLQHFDLKLGKDAPLLALVGMTN